MINIRPLRFINLFMVIAVITTACQSENPFDQVSEKDVTLLLKAPLYMTFSVSREEGAVADDETALNYLAKIDRMNKEEKIAFARSEIEAALT